MASKRAAVPSTKAQLREPLPQLFEPQFCGLERVCGPKLWALAMARGGLKNETQKYQLYGGAFIASQHEPWVVLSTAPG